MGTEINYTGKAPMYYAPFEVAIHNQPDDCWVSFLGKVWDITSLIQENIDKDTVKPLLAFAGKDISDWFDEETQDIKYHIHPITGCYVPYVPHGNIPDIQPRVPAERWRPYDKPPWWQDEKYVIALVTTRVRPIRIINITFCFETFMNVCAEDTLLRIKERYSMYNTKCHEYIWRHADRVLYDDLTLEENGVLDQRDHMGSVGMDPNFYIPAILIYFCDNMSDVSDSDSDDNSTTYNPCNSLYV